VILFPCDQKQVESQFSPTHASTNITKELKHNAECCCVRFPRLTERLSGDAPAATTRRFSDQEYISLEDSPRCQNSCNCVPRHTAYRN